MSAATIDAGCSRSGSSSSAASARPSLERSSSRKSPGGVQHSQDLARPLTVEVQLVHVNVDSVGGGIEHED
jgi:hypothetical protein